MIDSGEYHVIPKKRPAITRLVSTVLTYLIIVFIFFGNLFAFQYVYILFVVILFFLFAGIDKYIWRVRWETLAEQISLKINPKNRSFIKKPYITGQRHGYATTINTFSRGNGRSTQEYTQFVVEFSFDFPESFSIKKRGFLDGTDTPIDMEEVDKTFTIHTSTPHLVHKIFQTTRLRQGLFDLVRQTKTMNLSISDNRLIYFEKGRIVDVEYLTALFNFLHKISESFRHHSQFGF